MWIVDWVSLDICSLKREFCTVDMVYLVSCDGVYGRRSRLRVSFPLSPHVQFVAHVWMHRLRCYTTAVHKDGRMRQEFGSHIDM